MFFCYLHFILMIRFYPPFTEWRIQAREYLFKYKCDLDRTSSSDSTNRVVYNGGKRIVMKRPVEVVLFHAELNRADRYGPLMMYAILSLI